MSRHDKTLRRLLDRPTPVDIRWGDLKAALEHLGYKMLKNTGSRRKFWHEALGHVISVHEPHPQPVVKAYAIREVAEALQEQGLIER